MSIASGPQVIVNDDRIADNENGDDMYPWKRWHVVNDPMGTNSQPPISFFQPQSFAQELLGVYEKFTQIADDLSAIPRYITGSERMGGAGRTASGLAMLMGNAAKILQTVAANIDRDVIEPVIVDLYDMVMLTDTTGMLRGDESIDVLGVNVAIQRETQRQRQLEFLQITANPIDMQIMGVPGRAEVLRSVAEGIGLQGSTIVPSEEELKANQPPPGAAPPGASRCASWGSRRHARRSRRARRCAGCAIRSRPATAAGAGHQRSPGRRWASRRSGVMPGKATSKGAGAQKIKAGPSGQMKGFTGVGTQTPDTTAVKPKNTTGKFAKGGGGSMAGKSGVTAVKKA